LLFYAACAIVNGGKGQSHIATGVLQSMSDILQPGTIVHHRYRVTRLIGQGGMGAVYEAVDQTFHSKVALKQMFPTPNLPPQQVASMERAFEREARMLHQLRHATLPRVSDSFSDTHGRFLVMDYIEGEDMAALLKARGGPPGEHEVVPWALRVLDALEYLHQQQPPIIHRDIKPHNIKVTPAGEVFLIDFGIAKGITSQTTPGSHSSVYAYTLAYAPLEQIQGTGTDARSDLFSLGATMYHLLTGASLDEHPRCDALTRATATVSGQRDPLTPPPGVSQPVQNVLMRALALDPNRRPASATAMRQELEAALQAPTLVANTGPTLVRRADPPPPAPPQQRPAPPQKVHTAWNVMSMVSRGQQQRPAPPQKVHTAKAASTDKRGWIVAFVVVLAVLVGAGGGAFGDLGSLLAPAPEATPTSASAPLPGKIAFFSNRNGNYDIYVMNADGSNLQQLTTNEADDVLPAWSPDGERIAFESTRDGIANEIYVMNADGSNLQRLTTNEKGDYSPAWSPDGERIAFDSYRDSNFDIYVMNADGSNIQRLTTDEADDTFPAWAPDGERVAFHSGRDGNDDIYVMNADGSNIQRLTTDEALDTLPAWSPDGERIAFSSRRDGNYGIGIYVMNADGSNVQHITTNEERDGRLAWSPDGSRIAFASDRNGNMDIYVMNADGSNLQRLTTDEADDLWPAWAP
jgi:Tol biopolymer transport system component/serine/threonine protein kinase